MSSFSFLLISHNHETWSIFPWAVSYIVKLLIGDCRIKISLQLFTFTSHWLSSTFFSYNSDLHFMKLPFHTSNLVSRSITASQILDRYGSWGTKVDYLPFLLLSFEDLCLTLPNAFRMSPAQAFDVAHCCTGTAKYLQGSAFVQQLDKWILLKYEKLLLVVDFS